MTLGWVSILRHNRTVTVRDSFGQQLWPVCFTMKHLTTKNVRLYFFTAFFICLAFRCLHGFARRPQAIEILGRKVRLGDCLRTEFESLHLKTRAAKFNSIPVLPTRAFHRKNKQANKKPKRNLSFATNTELNYYPNGWKADGKIWILMRTFYGYNEP